MNTDDITLDVFNVNISIFFQKLDKLMNLPMNSSFKSETLLDAFKKSIQKIKTNNLNSNREKKRAIFKSFLLELLSQEDFAGSFGRVVSKVMTQLGKPYFKQLERLQRLREEENLRRLGVGPKWAREGEGGKVWDIPGDSSYFGGGKSKKRNKRKGQRGGFSWVFAGGVCWAVLGYGVKYLGTTMIENEVAVTVKHMNAFLERTGVSISKITYYLHLEAQQEAEAEYERPIYVPGVGFTSQRELAEKNEFSSQQLIEGAHESVSDARRGHDEEEEEEVREAAAGGGGGVDAEDPGNWRYRVPSQREREQYGLVSYQEEAPSGGGGGTVLEDVFSLPPPHEPFPLGPDVPETWSMMDCVDVLRRDPDRVAKAVSQVLKTRVLSIGDEGIEYSYPHPSPDGWFGYLAEFIHLKERPAAVMEEAGRVAMETIAHGERQYAFTRAQFKGMWDAVVFQIGAVGTGVGVVWYGDKMIMSGVVAIMGPYIIAYAGPLNAAMTVGVLQLAAGRSLPEAIISGLLVGNAPAIADAADGAAAAAGGVAAAAAAAGAQLALVGHGGGRKLPTRNFTRGYKKCRRKTKRRRRKKRKTRKKRRRSTRRR